MKIAFATRDGERVNAELRSAPRLDGYDVTAAAVRLDRSCALEDARNGNGARIELLDGVDVVYVSAIGPSTAARLAARGIRAATSRAGARIAALLAEVQDVQASLARERGPGAPHSGGSD